ncbi:hypothetical protein ACFQH6_20625 [Halobacteriaceae archaeon GCM10025711]
MNRSDAVESLKDGHRELLGLIAAFTRRDDQAARDHLADLRGVLNDVEPLLQDSGDDV